jgi:hypothetical protein
VATELLDLGPDRTHRRGVGRSERGAERVERTDLQLEAGLPGEIVLRARDDEARQLLDCSHYERPLPRKISAKTTASLCLVSRAP